MKNMNNQDSKCVCGKFLQYSQFADNKGEAESAVNADEDLVCRNYPECEKAEKEV